MEEETVLVALPNREAGFFTPKLKNKGFHAPVSPLPSSPIATSFTRLLKLPLNGVEGLMHGTPSTVTQFLAPTPCVFVQAWWS